MPYRINDSFTKMQRHRYRLKHPEYNPPKEVFTTHTNRKWNQPCSYNPNTANINPEYRRFKAQQYRVKILELLGNKCVRCGFNKDIRGLCIDHINGGGRKERKYGGQGMYHRILIRIFNGSKEYQCLCATCNQIKKVENKEWIKQGS